MMNWENRVHEQMSPYQWYEASEDPLWFTGTRPEVLSWWLRRDASYERNWFVEAYPTLAPYYPISVFLQGEDPLLPYHGYWWP